MKLGDFTALAKNYANRPGYPTDVLEMIYGYIKNKINSPDLTVADVGAGTGKLTTALSNIGLKGYSIEPNDAMREVGISEKIQRFEWRKGSGESTNLQDNCIDWSLMGDSFHWVNADVGIREFARILKPNGFFTVIYKPRDLEKSELHRSIEDEISKIVPNRVSSVNRMTDIEEKLLKDSLFDEIFYIEKPFFVRQTKEKYMGAWHSVNDIQVQAGDKWKNILALIEDKIKGMAFIEVPYKVRAWTVSKK